MRAGEGSVKRAAVATLQQRLADPPRRRAASSACAAVVRSTARRQSGVSGMAIKAALRGMEAVDRDAVEKLIVHLMPEFAAALEPMWPANEDPDGFATELVRDPRRATEALLAVTDARADRVGGPLAATYRRLRATAAKRVSEAMPELASALAGALR